MRREVACSGVWWIGALASLLLDGACVPFASGGVTAGSGDLVLAGTREGVLGLDSGRGRVAFSAPHAVLTGDGRKLVSARRDPGLGGRLTVLDGTTGREESRFALVDGLAPRVVSPNGRLVALSEPRSDGAAYTTPPGRDRTRILVRDTDGTSPPRELILDGNLEPEAFSLDERLLYLLDYLPPRAPDRYRVRALDLATGQTRPVPGLKGFAPEEEMRGAGRMQVLSPDRTRLYTLYTHQPDHLHSRDLARGAGTGREDVHAFVHVLNLKEDWAFCLDLPRPFGEGPAAAHALALSVDGRSLYVADRSSGLVTVADPLGLQISRTVNVGVDAQRPNDALAAARVATDGTLYVSSGKELLALDGTSLARRGFWNLEAPATGLALSPNGALVYLARTGHIAAVDAATGATLGRIAAPGVRTLLVVAPISTAMTP